MPRVVAFGGVFPPGMLDGYFNPVYVSEAAGQLIAITDRAVTQLFNQYVCPVVVVWDPNGQAVYHTFFGGISRSFYFQTAEQSSAYQTNTAQGRNDGLPYVADISTLILGAGGASAEYIAPTPIVDNRLCGTFHRLHPRAEHDQSGGVGGRHRQSEPDQPPAARC